MSGASLTSPTPDPDADDKHGLQESFEVIRAKRPPTAFGQNGLTLCPETSPIGTGQDLRSAFLTGPVSLTVGQSPLQRGLPHNFGRLPR